MESLRRHMSFPPFVTLTLLLPCSLLLVVLVYFLEKRGA
ncbi:hypothetical protein NC653_014098 [Populus alba x Populus x berolinensis]|uniref:Uncharacterized protein n=1 Tax=Populus alba x Populus x berolinensis TaxID=444605 RepID=A0AAD6QW74_9ROSI|nr:hypothetical protein NC653_014098 [Populus alba x Populus x berolinensis]